MNLYPDGKVNDAILMLQGNHNCCVRQLVQRIDGTNIRYAWHEVALFAVRHLAYDVAKEAIDELLRLGKL